MRKYLYAGLYGILIVALGLIQPASADFQDGSAAYQRGDYQTALREWRPLAEQGDATVQFFFAIMYIGGQGVPQDFAEAVRWARRAAEQGVARRQTARRCTHAGSARTGISARRAPTKGRSGLASKFRWWTVTG